MTTKSKARVELGNVDDKPFDFLHSSHVRNAVQA